MRILAIFFAICWFSLVDASAGYAYPKPPPTWKPNPSGVGGLYRSPSNARRDSANNNWYTDVAEVYLPGAGNIKYPVSMKEAANAANFLAKRSFVPRLLGTAALTLMAEWLSSAGLQTWIDPLTGQQVWAKPQDPITDADGLEYTYYGSPYNISPKRAAEAGGLIAAVQLGRTFISVTLNPATKGATYTFRDQDGADYIPTIYPTTRQSPCPLGWTPTPAGCLSPAMRPVTQPEFESDLSPLKIPIELPPLLPFDLPVDDPITNPKPFPFGDPAPFFVPTGDPVLAPAPRPDPDPYPWVEPGLDVKPAPKPEPEPDPWRLEPKPVINPKPDPNPTPNPNPTPAPSPNPNPNPSPNPAPSPIPEKDPGLCALFPDILACETLGDAPQTPELQDKQIDVQITPSGGFGANSATCPSDKMVQLTFINRSIPITYSYLCGMALGVRPVVLALAWLSAALIVLGMGRKS
jgi:hypothetical protein